MRLSDAGHDITSMMANSIVTSLIEGTEPASDEMRVWRLCTYAKDGCEYMFLQNGHIVLRVCVDEITADEMLALDDLTLIAGTGSE